MFRIFPREETFLPQFGRAAQVIVDAARVLDAMADEPGTGIDRPRRSSASSTRATRSPTRRSTS